ncbi:PHP domain-containing protein [Synechococcus sp. BA-132 BA5]|uniref:PHP domain-containing protein n=1 Tax=Synechococcus sp. BA-132 BA5 TaxID=3110252 RepID=UPI002B1EEBBE|nr:PHP domain-containing protein [Synechococcus sp. BA-132 BA5]MEA5417174.1 PHP domain-containing protein [Synechococcus sp. BA-132 BA5]
MLRPEALAHPLTPVLRQVQADSCPGRLNFHCHTICSDGSLHPEELAAEAVAIGLEHLAVTDHHALAAHGAIDAAFTSHRQRGATTPTLWRGVEISCLLEGCLVHVLGLGFAEEHPSLDPYLQGTSVVGPALQAKAVVAAIRAAEGLALLAHPARYRLPHQRLIAAAADLGFDGAEVWYDYAMQPRWQPTDLVCEAIAADLERRGLLMSCGTDTHGLVLRGR